MTSFSASALEETEHSVLSAEEGPLLGDHGHPLQQARRRWSSPSAIAGLALTIAGALLVASAALHGSAAPTHHPAGTSRAVTEDAPRGLFQPIRQETRPPLTFYVYRAQGPSSYPLENINAADLAGVMWYLHNEVVVSSPRKYGIDRIRRYKISVKNTEEFWNVHHRNFGAFLAFDAARCTTPICGEVFSQYGFIVGCQVQSTDIAPYLGSTMTRVDGACKGQFCNAPVWYSLPGRCPTQGLSNQQIEGNTGSQDVMKAKDPACIAQQPGGRCHAANGAPDCTFSYEEAGQIMLDELSGIEDYNYFWNVSYKECTQEVAAGQREGPCVANQEFDLARDKGVNCSFWDHKTDVTAASKRMQAVRDLFKKHYPDMAYDYDTPACDFDMYYDGESKWPRNHTNSVPATRGFSWSHAKDMLTTTPPPVAADVPHTCKALGCGQRSERCACNTACVKYNDCCADYAEKCVELVSPLGHKAPGEQQHAERRHHSEERHPVAEEEEKHSVAEGHHSTREPEHMRHRGKEHVAEALSGGKTADHLLRACMEAMEECDVAVGVKKDLSEACQEIARECAKAVRITRGQDKEEEKHTTSSRAPTRAPSTTRAPATTTAAATTTDRRREVHASPKEVIEWKGDEDDNGVGAEMTACRVADKECNEAVTWAKVHGIVEHPEWYKGLSTKSTADEFRELLRDTGRGSCDKVCTSDSNMLFLHRRK